MILKGKVVMITGAAQGIGKACADRFAKEGADLVLLDIDKELIEKIEAQFNNSGQSCLAQRADISSLKEVEEAVTKALDKFKKKQSLQLYFSCFSYFVIGGIGGFSPPCLQLFFNIQNSELFIM